MKRKLLLVQPPIGRYDTAEVAPPLSLLSLRLSAIERGYECDILDLNLPSYRPLGDSASFYDTALDLIASHRPTDVGITSMGVNSHVAILLGSRVAVDLGCHTTLGGIHLSSIAEIARSVLPSSVRVHTGSETHDNDWWAAVPSLASPVSAHRLFDGIELAPYFDANVRRVANFEGGRGCKYSCAFCYSPPTHFRWITHPPSFLVESFGTMEELGFRHVFLVEDNLTNSPPWLLDFAARLTCSDVSLTWNGYATLPDLTTDIVARVASANCTNLYIGIDAVVPAQQRAWRKSFFKTFSQVEPLLHAARDHGMQLTCAFILDIDPQSDATTAVTLEVARLLADAGADTRLAVITAYPKTALGSLPAAEYSEDHAAILMDLPQVVVENSLAPHALNAFPWHARPKHLAGVWERRLLAVHAAQVILNDTTCRNYSDELWSQCLAVATTLNDQPSLHKSELKQAVRTIHASLTTAA